MWAHILSCHILSQWDIISSYTRKPPYPLLISNWKGWLFWCGDWCVLWHLGRQWWWDNLNRCEFILSIFAVCDITVSLISWSWNGEKIFLVLFRRVMTWLTQWMKPPLMKSLMKKISLKRGTGKNLHKFTSYHFFFYNFFLLITVKVHNC